MTEVSIDIKRRIVNNTKMSLAYMNKKGNPVTHTSLAQR